jgi:predicted DCC family thiol-disulfide oxidoreductase YuxK
MSGPILFFDGVCNLCQGAVQFVIRHNKSANVRFASLQSNAGKQAIEAVRQQYGRVPDSLILLENDHYYIESDAALRVAGHFSGGWKVLYGLRWIPRFIRDFVYRLVAKRRYHWFGKKEECWLPTEELKMRFLED